MYPHQEHPYPDVYTIQLRDPAPPVNLTPGRVITLRLQKFHYCKEPSSGYQPIFSDEILFNLTVQSCQPKGHRVYNLPYILDGHPQNLLCNDQAVSQDPILRSLHPLFRMVFRYNPELGIGCLVHFGCDFGRPEDNPICPLWITALNIERRQQQDS